MMGRLIPGSSFARALACAVTLAVAASCSPGGLTSGPKLAKAQTLSVMLEDQPSSLDPGQTQYPYETAVLRAISEPLLKPAPDLTGVVPAAAQSYDVVDNGTIYVFHLRTNAKYSDGTPVKAQDFVYAWQRLIDPRLASPEGTFFADVVLNGDKVSLLDPQRDASTIDAALATLGLKALDDFTFQVTLAHPFPAFVWLAAMPAGAPVRKDVVKANGDKWAASAQTLITNGPFRVTEMVANDHITVERNPYYWGAKPTLTSIRFVIANDGATALADYKSGALDIARVEPAQASAVASDSTLSQNLVKTPDLTVFWLVFRVNSPPLDNVKLRLAIAQAIDRQALVSQIFQGQAMPADSFIPQGMDGHYAGGSPQRFDVAEARASLAASGLSAKQVSLTYAYNQASDFGKAVANFVHDQLKTNLGIEITLQPLDPNTLASRLSNGQFQIAGPGTGPGAGPTGWTADYPDPADWFDIFLTTSSDNLPFFQVQQYDNFVAVARTDGDPARRGEEYQQAESMLLNQAPVAFLAQTVSWYLVAPYVRGVVTSPVDEWPGALDPQGISIAPH